MENSYGIGIANRYALFLDEEEDPLEVLKVQEQEKEAKKKTKLSEKENKGKPENKGKSTQLARKGIKDAQNVKTLDSGKSKEENNKTKTVPRPVPERNVKFAESSEERNNRRNREERPFSGAGDFNREGARQDGGEMRGRGRGAGRGMGRGRGTRGGGSSGIGTGGRGGYDNRGKREFDRQSGSDKTGVKSVDKRDGGGAHNWGNHKDDIAEELHTSHLPEDQQEWSAEKGDDGPPAVEVTDVKDTDIGGGDEAETAQPTEEEPRELTLDEYYAIRGSRQKPTYNLRKAGEGEDLTQWKNMYALKKKEGEEEEEEEEEYDAADYPQRVGRQKIVLDIDIHFADSRRGTRGRGRGGPRGAGRGGTRGGGGGAAAAAASSAPSAAAAASRGTGEGRSPPAPRGFGERSERFDRADRDVYQSRTQRQSAPKVDDEHDFPSLG